jgi:PAS domain S-box-containing protein
MEKAKILIVEDEAIIAMEVESQLQSLGYEITSIVDTGEKAIKKAEEDEPDLILMDIRIKGEMDGIDTAEVIRNQFGIPVIFSTAYLDEERTERAKITMPFGYVLKPIQERDLKVTLEMALYVAKVDAERRIVEKKLQKSESLHKEAQVVAHIGHWELDSPLGTPIWSDEVFRIFSLDPETDAPSFSEHRNIIHAEDWPSLEKSITLLNEDGTPFNIQFRILRSDGKIGWMHAIGIAEINSAGLVTRMFGTAQDITEIKQVEESLKETEEKHRTLFETTTQGVVYQNAEGIITDANPAAERILGLSLNQMKGKTSIDPRWKAIHEDGSDFPGETHPGMVALKTGKKVNNVVMGVFHPQKEEHRWININAVPKFKEGESTPYENFVTFDDITELKTGKK